MKSFGKVSRHTNPEVFMFVSEVPSLISLLHNFGALNESCILDGYQNKKFNTDFCVFPHFGSNIIVEYHHSDDKVVVNYNGTALKLCDGKESCTLDEFDTLVKNMNNDMDFQDVINTCYPL